MLMVTSGAVAFGKFSKKNLKGSILEFKAKYKV